MSKRNYSNEQIDVPVEDNNLPIKELVGVITGCQSLNIRTNPSIEAMVLCRETALSEVIINLNKSTDEWYNVCTVTGVEGFCMKKFITVKQ